MKRRGHKSVADQSRPLSSSELLTQAFVAANTNQPRLAVELFSEASSRDPQDPFILLELAKCSRRIQQVDRMRSALDRAKRLAKRDPVVSLAYAKACEQMRDLDEARATYERLLKQRRCRVAAQVGLASIYERLNQLDKSQAVMSEIAFSAQRQPAVRLMQAQLFSRLAEYEKAERLLRSLVNCKDKKTVHNASYLLASCLDKQGGWNEAMEVLHRVKRSQSQSQETAIALRGFRAARDMAVRALGDASADDVHAWLKSASQLPERQHRVSFLLGHPRSGTTLLEQVLAAHDEVGDADETGCFHDTVWFPLSMEAGREYDNQLYRLLVDLPVDTTHSMRDDYFRHLQFEIGVSGHERIWLDKNPALTLQLLPVLRVFPDAKLIVALRDPRDVCISAYMQRVELTNWSANWLTLESTVEMYVLAMDNWLRLRDWGGFESIEVRYEDCVDDLSVAGRRVFDFLGIEWRDDLRHTHRHVETKAVFSPTYGDVSKPVYNSSIGRWRNYANQLEPFKDRLEPFVKAFGYV